jgi:hypothetical protein
MLIGMPHRIQNIGQWIGFSCPLDLQNAVAVMVTVDSGVEINDSPLTGEASKPVDSSLA